MMYHICFPLNYFTKNNILSIHVAAMAVFHSVSSLGNYSLIYESVAFQNLIHYSPHHTEFWWTLCAISTSDKWPKGWDRVSTSPTLDQSQTWDRERRVREWSAVTLSWASPCICARSLCEGHGAPGTAPPLCPQDPADEEPLNGLDFCPRNLMGVFITAILDTCPGVWRSLWHVTLTSPF